VQGFDRRDSQLKSREAKTIQRRATTLPNMSSFFARLERRVDEHQTLLCIGLDPHIGDLVAPTAKGAQDFCYNIIDATHEYAAAFKPNSAFFEVFGAEGHDALAAVIAKVRALHIPVILDAKRGDISTTAEAYATSAFKHYNADSVTVNPYMGGVFVAYCCRVVVATSIKYLLDR
jgi:orotidine 5'-phosphate decarboxylase subfamily 2